MTAGVSATTHRIDAAHSTVRFTAKSLFGLATVRGTIPIRHGTVVVSADPGRRRVEATIDVAGFDTANRRRDLDVRSARFLDAARHPTMTFTSTAVADDSLTGDLTVCGVTRRITIALTPGPPGHHTGRTSVDRHDFGVTAARGFISRHVEIELDILTAA